MKRNEELELAYQFVSQTDRHLFLTGKAGTGKTTFLHRVRETVGKRKVVVAPTGVAAINAKGVTIHSQFQLPFGVLDPDRLRIELPKHRLASKKVEVVRRLDLLVIDEISMVRADVLDAIGAVLRKYRRNDLPFGGVQLLMVGDLHQLPPVVRDADWEKLRAHYKSPYFFDSLELQRAGKRTVQLKHIYRQSDGKFIDLLNRVRDDRLDAASLELLNSRYRGEHFEAGEEDDYITLTSHNAQANTINGARLGELKTPLVTFSAETTGSFPESMYPNAATLQFRVGAQVMFNKNDTAEQRYYNGKIGRVTKIEKDKITVACPGGERIEVEPVAWENRKFEVDKKSSEVTDEVVGTYTQHPLRLAWAITIHKSQGLTFERVIIDAANAFAHGQVYVALSRCKTFEGIVLRSRILDRSVRTDRVVSSYSEQAAASPPTLSDLLDDRMTYQLNCLQQLFDFTEPQRNATQLHRALFEHERSIKGGALVEVEKLRTRLRTKVSALAVSFRRQLTNYGHTTTLPVENEELSMRLTGAVKHFTPIIEAIEKELGNLTVLSDNQAVKKTVEERLAELRLALLIKSCGLESLREGYDPERLLRSRTEAERKFSEVKVPTAKTALLATVTDHPVLYQRLTEWRTQLAAEQDLPAFRILPNSVLIAISSALPDSEAGLMRIRGFGAKSREAFAGQLLEILDTYRGEVVMAPGAQAVVKPRALPDEYLSSGEVSLREFRKGHTVAKIAESRGLTEGTIFSHLSRFVLGGDLPIETLISAETIAHAAPLFRGTEAMTIREAYEFCAMEYDYAALRLIKSLVITGRLLEADDPVLTVNEPT